MVSGGSFGFLPSCSGRYRWRPTQTIDHSQDALEYSAWQTRFGHLEDGITRMFDQPRAGLDQAFPERGQRPGCDGLRRRDGAQEIGKVVGQGVQLEPHGVSGEAHAGEPGPLQRVLAFLDVLFCRASIVLEREHPLVRQAAIGHQEADGREQFARMKFDLGDDAPGLRPALGAVMEACVAAHGMIWRSASRPLGQERHLLMQFGRVSKRGIGPETAIKDGCLRVC